MATAVVGSSVDAKEVLRQCRVAAPSSSRRKAPTEIDLTLDEYSICWTQNNKNKKISHEILLEDLIGVSVPEQASSNTREKSCSLTITHYPLITKRGGAKRCLETKSFEFCANKTFEDNRTQALEWKKAILDECERAVRKKFAFAEEHKGEPTELCYHQRRFLVLINPVSGPGKSVQLYRSQVQPLFDLAEIKCEVIITNHANHAHELVKEYDLSSIDGIVIASGDGLLYEVVNGLMERPDWQQAIKTPIGMLPTGSGNALVTSILHEAEEEYSLKNAAFCIIRGGIQATDIATVQKQDGRKVYMSLLSCWGFAADSDIESERFRFIGGTRFLLGFLYAVAKKKVYQGRLHYLPLKDEESARKENGDSALEQGKDEAKQGKEIQQSGLPTTLLPDSLADPVPSHWKTVDGSFSTLVTILSPFLGKDYAGVLSHSLGTGTINILYATGDIKRKALLQILSKSSSGEYVNLPEVKVVEARAYRLEPLTVPGLLVVDGEVMEYGPVQAQVHNKISRVMTRRRKGPQQNNAATSS